MTRKRKPHYNHRPKRRSNIDAIITKFTRFSAKHPIFSTGCYFLMAIVLFRFSLLDYSTFGYTAAQEIRFWLLVVAGIMVLLSILSVVAWWRRNVPSLFVRGDINWNK